MLNNTILVADLNESQSEYFNELKDCSNIYIPFLNSNKLYIYYVDFGSNNETTTNITEVEIIIDVSYSNKMDINNVADLRTKILSKLRSIYANNDFMKLKLNQENIKVLTIKKVFAFKHMKYCQNSYYVDLAVLTTILLGTIKTDCFNYNFNQSREVIERNIDSSIHYFLIKPLSKEKITYEEFFFSSSFKIGILFMRYVIMRKPLQIEMNENLNIALKPSTNGSYGLEAHLKILL